MKAIITIFILLTATTFCNAQYQSIFGQYSTQWIFEWHNLNVDWQDTVYVEKDTTAFGHDWKKIIADDYYEGLLREDTTIGKVWFKQLFGGYPDTIEKLLFDFSLNINDTFNIDNSHWGGEWKQPHCGLYLLFKQREAHSFRLGTIFLPDYGKI